MSAIPNLFLKWRAFREIVGQPLSDAQIGTTIFGPNEGAAKFSKLLYGDYGCSTEVGTELVQIVNRRVDGYRKARGLAPDGTIQFRTSDLELPVYEFTRRLVTAAGQVDPDALDRAHNALLKEMSPSFDAPNEARLVIERFSTERSFESAMPSGGTGPTEFQVGKHKGRLAVQGTTGAPRFAYTLFTRDPRGAGMRLWDLDWNETVLWLPSPSVPTVAKGTVLIMPEAQSLQPIPGRFIATAVLLWDESVKSQLDPRGKDARPGALDEPETSRFLTNLRRVVRKRPEAVTVSSAEYLVTV